MPSKIVDAEQLVNHPVEPVDNSPALAIATFKLHAKRLTRIDNMQRPEMPVAVVNSIRCLDQERLKHLAATIAILMLPANLTGKSDRRCPPHYTTRWNQLQSVIA